EPAVIPDEKVCDRFWRNFSREGRLSLFQLLLTRQALLPIPAVSTYIEECYRESDSEIAELGLPDAIVRTRLLPHTLDFYRWLKSALRRKPQVAGGMGAIETLRSSGKKIGISLANFISRPS